MVKVVLATMLLASWLLQSCTSDDDAGLAEGLPGAPCVKPASLAKPAGGPVSVRVGVTGALSEAAAYLADAEGYFAREGLRVQMINFTSPSRMLPALAAAQLDVASASVGPGLFNASGNNLCVKVVGPLTRQEVNANGVFLFLRSDVGEGGKLHDYGDLKGLQLAVSGRDSSSEYALSKLLQAGGLSLKDVRLLRMSYPTMMVGLANKSVGGSDALVRGNRRAAPARRPVTGGGYGLRAGRGGPARAVPIAALF